MCACGRCSSKGTRPTLTHLVHPGQGAHVLPGTITVSSERAPVPQGAFLPQGVVQDETLLTPLVTQPVEIHSCPQLQRCSDPQRQLQSDCGSAPLCSPEQSVKAEIHVM